MSEPWPASRLPQRADSCGHAWIVGGEQAREWQSNLMTNGEMRLNQRSPSDERMERLMRALISLASIPERGGCQGSSMAGSGSSDQGAAQALVVEFDDAYTDLVEGLEQLPSESQMIALQAVDTRLSAMVGAKDATLWTDRAQREDQIWTELRELVTEVIGEFARREPELETGPGMPTDRTL